MQKSLMSKVLNRLQRVNIYSEQGLVVDLLLFCQTPLTPHAVVGVSVVSEPLRMMSTQARVVLLEFADGMDATVTSICTTDAKE